MVNKIDKIVDVTNLVLTTIDKAKELYDQIVGKFKELLPQPPKNLKVIKVEVLGSDDLIKIAKENIVPGANEVIALREETKDDTII